MWISNLSLARSLALFLSHSHTNACMHERARTHIPWVSSSIEACLIQSTFQMAYWMSVDLQKEQFHIYLNSFSTTHISISLDIVAYFNLYHFLLPSPVQTGTSLPLLCPTKKSTHLWSSTANAFQNVQWVRHPSMDPLDPISHTSKAFCSLCHLSFLRHPRLFLLAYSH